MLYSLFRYLILSAPYTAVKLSSNSISRGEGSAVSPLSDTLVSKSSPSG